MTGETTPLHHKSLARALGDVVGPWAGEVDRRARFPRAGLAALAGAGVLALRFGR